ncbi:sodium-independent sulfate anion transporter-like isoform X2 [Agrilus planipennis]|uniref:Sodium-independent sulfate anion transporter-like isoform X2 n=1 Tax=Agrilus planipennis TaxID=224129 RepID=A0A1W4X8R3_AGRPL|nr:sodium-independent sulfate anion transporter-like isoform X2 [Agrilus planipennis]
MITTTNSSTPNNKWRSFIRRRVPILNWIPFYTTSKLLHDLLAGFTVALTEVPQGIAFAVVAGLDPQYGLYSGFMGVFAYFLFGTGKDLNIGPTSILALMLQPHVEAMGADMAVLMSFLAGIIIFALGLLRLGFILDFFSYPIISGFTTSAALQILSSQIKSLFGITGKASKFLNAWIEVFENIKSIKLWDTVLGCICTLLILGIKYLGKRKGSSRIRSNRTRTQNIIAIFLWFMSLISYAIVVMGATVLAYILYQYGHTPFQLTGTVKKGLPPFTLPPFSTTFNNETYSFVDMMNQYGGTTAFLPLVAILEHVSISKAFAKGKTIDATQELFALGLCNFFGAFVQSMPVTGSFTRTAVNNVSGVKTTAGGFFTGTFVLLVLAFMTSFFYYIPKTTLASVVISAMIGLIQYDTVFVLWRTKKLDLIPYFATLLCCLLWNLEYGILVGIATNLSIVLYFSARPPIVLDFRQIDDKKVYLVVPETSLLFPAAEHLKEKLLTACQESESLVVLDGCRIKFIDATIAKSFKSLIDEFKVRNQFILFLDFNDSVINTCVSLDPSLEKYFVNGTLDDVVSFLF